MNFPELVRYDCNTLLQDEDPARSAPLRKAVLETCFTGGIAVLNGDLLSIDLDEFLAARPFPPDHCKLGTYCSPGGATDEFDFNLVTPGLGDWTDRILNKDGLDALCETSFGGDRTRLRRFANHCRETETQLRTVASRVLAGFDYYTDCAVWRFAYPESMRLHYDTTPPLLRKDSLRFFVNLDSVPRVWECSFGLLDAMSEKYHDWDLGTFFDGPTDKKMVQLAKRVASQIEDAPRVRFSFAPGAVWVCDGRTVSHTVAHGVRAFSLTTKMGLKKRPADHTPLRDRLFQMHDAQRQPVPA